MYGYPAPQQLSGRGENCVRETCESVSYMWSHNPAAVVGIALCLLLLIVWKTHISPSRPEGEESEQEE